jgi:hypothetical protein
MRRCRRRTAPGPHGAHRRNSSLIKPSLPSARIARILLRCVVSVCSLRAKVGRCKKKKKNIATQASKFIFRLPAILKKQLNPRKIRVPILCSSYFFTSFCFSLYSSINPSGTRRQKSFLVIRHIATFHQHTSPPCFLADMNPLSAAFPRATRSASRPRPSARMPASRSGVMNLATLDDRQLLPPQRRRTP